MSSFLEFLWCVILFVVFWSWVAPVILLWIGLVWKLPDLWGQDFERECYMDTLTTTATATVMIAVVVGLILLIRSFW